MARISVGAAVGAGFGLIARRPVSVIVWGLLPTLLQGLIFATLAPYYVAIYGEMINSATSGTPFSPAMSPQLMQMQGMAQLFNLAQLFVSALINCAVFRAVLHPEKSSFAYLRVGGAELFVMVLLVGAVIVFVIALIVVMIPVGIVVAIVAVATHGGGLVVGILIPIFVVAVMVAFVVLGLRFAFVGPMIIEDGAFHLMESWTMTRGRVGSLFLIALALIGVFLLIDIVLLALILALGAGAVASLGGLGPAGTLFQQSPQAALARIAPFLVIYLAVLVPFSGCVLAIGGAPWAKAYRDLLPSAADTFA